ncbi:electron transfer flavoprotein subunit beta/FixA family protein [Effusibacillus lacus]|uniref:Electron transfer flavoprotein subunit beta n=1 Tax=Effusibacillus lacus TaxID=1348429 RepID=A0A292YGP1_9BACL|nr:electron transfer flavoprotein subunit beta/FixA family protein [Effusibacillus lacus]TCS74767.1 electron transfer flavoprotein beta subunit [Effusibacillus lacus]GAX88578.1 electron transfer flavoprotein subunit beta [Effusibacillus lacus]
MNILVLLKETFDTAEKIVIHNGKITVDDVKFIINPYDEYAVEEAIKLKETHGGEVTVITVGPARAENALRTALAMGADKAILVDDESLFGDEYTISMVLAAVAKKEKYDMILAGYMAVDDGAAQVGPRLAELLDIPHISTITKLEVEEDRVIVEKDVEGNTEIIEASLPILLTAQQGLNEPRYPSLPGIMKAKKKPLIRLTAADLNVRPEEMTAKTEVLDQYLPAQKKARKILTGELISQVRELVELLRNETKVV